MADISRLPNPRMELWEWQYQGSCRATGGERFFHPEGERGTARERRDEAAKAVCEACPVIDLCRDHALTAREPYGVWGGMTEDERVAHYTRERRASRRTVKGGRTKTAAKVPSAQTTTARTRETVPDNALTMSIGG